MYSIRDSKSTKFIQKDDPRMTIDLSMAQLNLYPSCFGNTGRMLHGISRYKIAVFLS